MGVIVGNDLLLKRIEELEKQVKELSKKDKLNMFGSTHDTVGSSTSDLVLKTRGKIKILFGNKFIDLLKDGKLNINSDLIYKVSDKNSIGNKVGIYITDEGIYLKPKSEDPINLLGKVGTTYVSFLEPLETSSDNKHTALVNVGFLYSDMNSISENSLKNGIIYVESELKLYHIKNGELSEYTFTFPNPYNKLFILSKNDYTLGALLIQGQGINNSLAFDSLFIYNSDTQSFIDSEIPITININNKEILNISENESEFTNPIITNSIKSPRSEFQLSVVNGKSILSVDLILEKETESSKNYFEYWLLNNNIILSSELVNEKTKISFISPHSYSIGTILRVYQDNKPINLKVTEIIDNLSLYIELSNLNINNTLAFQIYPGTPIRIKGNLIDLVTFSENLEETIIARFGKLDDSTFGIRSNYGEFKEILYSSDYELPIDDNSSKLASTEWINNKFANPFPIGSIIMFNGESAPDGWHICDGNDGTPDLTDKFTDTLIFIMKIN